MALKDYFFFTKEERRGVVVLLIIICTLIGVRISIAALVSDESEEMKSVKTIQQKYSSEMDKNPEQENQLAVTDNNQKPSKYKKYIKRETGEIELNTADTIQLQELKGIGPGFARRIFKYREMLGGFYAKEQLMEVYGFTENMYELIKNDIVVDASKVIQINVNELDISHLKRHPYISYYEAKAIYDYRMTQPGAKIKSVDELSSLPDLKENWEVIKIYIKAE